MRNILVYIIIFQIFCGIKFPYEWNFNFNNIINTLDNFATNLEKTSSLFISEIQQKLSDFKNYTEEKKNEIIDTTQKEYEQLYKNFKKEKSKYIKAFVEKTTELSQLLSYKICNITNIDSYENCRNNKKNIFSDILEKIKDEFQISKIFGYNFFSNYYEHNLKEFLYLLFSITINYDSIANSKSYIIFDLVFSSKDIIEKYMPKMANKLKDQTQILSYKQDISTLLVKSISNLVNIIHFEEIDGYIKNINKTTGLIMSKQAKTLYDNIFKVLPILNEFGNKFYNISNKLFLNVGINPGNLEANLDAKLTVYNFEDKGIKIYLHSNFLLRITGASFIQTVVFDSPLVSIRGGMELYQGLTSNYFVGITLYDKNGKPIIVKDIDLYKPIIYYKKKLFNAMGTCLLYNEKANKMENTGIISKIINLDGEEYIKCIPNHLTTFTIGSYKEAYIYDSSDKIIIIIMNLFCLILLLF